MRNIVYRQQFIFPFRRLARCLTLLMGGLILSFPVAAEWYGEEQEKMGTRVEVQLWDDDSSRATQLLTASMAEFDRIEALMSTYIPESELSRVNRLAAEAPQPVSAELFGLLETALEVSLLTDGAFDISYDSVGVLYDFRRHEKPSELEIQEQIENIDYRLIELNTEKQTVYFRQQGVRINLGGIAKGYAVERVIKLLAEAGISNALATAGGDTRLLGDRIEKPWIVGIQDPNKASAIFTRLALEDEAVSTSGDYERFFVQDGIRYHHILTPGDGKPVRGVRSVTIIGPDATMTDALSTSVFVMGPEAGLKLIDSLINYEAVILGDEHIFYSTGLNPS